MATRRCVFCGENEVTREHVWPEWLQTEMAARFGEADWTVKRRDQSFQMAKLDAIVKRVCEPCNNNWMSALEGRTKPLLLPMMFGEQKALDLTPATQAALATWAFKTMLTANFLYPGAEIAPRVYSRFFSERVPPKHCTIWTGAYMGPKLSLTTNINPVSFLSPSSYNNDGILVNAPEKMQATSGTLVAIRAVFHVMLYEGRNIPMTSAEDGRLLWRIWPTSDRTLSWPPKGLAMTDAILDDFMEQAGPNR